MSAIVLIRGGGDLASGVAMRLHRAGIQPAIVELPQPLAVRRKVSFAEAVYEGECTIEGLKGCRVSDALDLTEIKSICARHQIPVIVDPDCACATHLQPAVIVDARLLKRAPEPLDYSPALHIGLGPGFEPGVNCDAVVETRRSHFLGRVFFTGTAQSDTGQPEGDPNRVLRAPKAGRILAHVDIGAHVEKDQIIAVIEPVSQAQPSSSEPITAPFKGVVRGLIHPGLIVAERQKVGDVDPRDEACYCTIVSDKSLAVGGGVLEAILSRADLRNMLWE